jgi:hypothetical protein
MPGLQNLTRQIRCGGVRNGVMRVHHIQLPVARHLDDGIGEREQVLRLAEQRVRRRLDALEEQVGVAVAPAERDIRC